MVNQFDVYWVDLNPTVGAEIVPVTSAIHGYPYRVRCHIMGRDGEMATDQIRTIDKRRLKNRIATLTADETESLQDVLRQMFCE